MGSSSPSGNANDTSTFISRCKKNAQLINPLDCLVNHCQFPTAEIASFQKFLVGGQFFGLDTADLSPKTSIFSSQKFASVLDMQALLKICQKLFQQFQALFTSSKLFSKVCIGAPFLWKVRPSPCSPCAPLLSSHCFSHSLALTISLAMYCPRFPRLLACSSFSTSCSSCLHLSLEQSSVMRDVRSRCDPETNNTQFKQLLTGSQPQLVVPPSDVTRSLVLGCGHPELVPVQSAALFIGHHTQN